MVGEKDRRNALIADAEKQKFNGAIKEIAAIIYDGLTVDYDFHENIEVTTDNGTKVRILFEEIKEWKD